MIKYINDKQQEIELSKSAKVQIKEANFHEKEWDYDSSSMRLGIRIKQFKKSPIEMKLILKFSGKRAEIVKNLNTFYAITESDILNKTPGRLYFNDWYIECYVLTDITKPEDDYGVEKEIQILAPYPFWIRETKTVIAPDQIEVVGEGTTTLPQKYYSGFIEIGEANTIKIKNFENIKNYGINCFFMDDDGNQIGGTFSMNDDITVMPGSTQMGMYSILISGAIDVIYELIREPNRTALDYPYDYPYDLLTDKNMATLTNESVVPQDARIIIYGPAISPQIVIGDNIYTVFSTIYEQEKIEINTKAKTIYKISEEGEKTNLFSQREPRTDFFKKIERGSNKVMWDGSFGLDVILMEERSTPEWI